MGKGRGGGFGLPGDDSSPSRFIQLAFTKEFSVKGENEQDGVSRMFRAFAPADILKGSVKADPSYDAYEQTLCTTAMCAESGVYYFSPAQNRRISAVRLPGSESAVQYFDIGYVQDFNYRN